MMRVTLACLLVLSSMAPAQSNCYERNGSVIAFASETWDAFGLAFKNLNGMTFSADRTKQLNVLLVGITDLADRKKEYLNNLVRFKNGSATVDDVNETAKNVIKRVVEMKDNLRREGERNVRLSTSSEFAPLYGVLSKLKQEKDTLCRVEQSGANQPALDHAIEAITAEIKKMEELQRSLTTLVKPKP